MARRRRPIAQYPSLKENLIRRDPDFDTLAECVELGIITEAEAGVVAEMLAIKDALEALAETDKGPSQ